MKSNLSLQSREAFTLTELCVILGCVAVLALLVLPALAGSKGNSQVFQCMENTRRLTLAWRMYAEDNNDLMVYSSDDGMGTAPYQTIVSGSLNKGNLYAWTWSKMDFYSNNPFNWDTNADITLRPLWQYVKDATVYKCPADQSQALHNGVLTPRIRSYSMNYYLGGFGDNSTAILSGAGPWVSHFPIYTKLTELGNLRKAPGPSQTFIFVDERSDCINWGSFATDFSGYPLPPNTKPTAAVYQWNEDLPASCHNRAACLSFADGHAEIHRWQDNVTLQPLKPNGILGSGNGTAFPDPYGQDVAWMQNVTARPH